MITGYFYRLFFEDFDSNNIKEFRILAFTQQSARYIFLKICHEKFEGMEYRVIKSYTFDIYEISPILTEAANLLEGYFNPTGNEISIEYLLPYTPVDCRKDIIDEILREL